MATEVQNGAFEAREPLPMDENVADHWRKWKQKWQLYVIASKAAKNDEETQCAIFLHRIGDDIIKVFNTFTFEDDEECRQDKKEERNIRTISIQHVFTDRKTHFLSTHCVPRQTPVNMMNTPVSLSLTKYAFTTIQRTIRVIQKCFYCFMPTFFRVLVDICE